MTNDPTAGAARIAEAFVGARRAARSLAVYPATPPATLDEAYAIQAQAIGLWRAPIAGWKVGRIPDPQIAALGANRLAGPIFAGTVVWHAAASPVEMAVFGGGFAAVEAEFVAELGGDPPAGQAHFSMEEAAALVGRLYCGIEIASSPLATINSDGAAVTVSDFGNNAGLIVGPEVPDWRASDYADWPIEVRVDGAVAGRKTAAEMLDGPIGAVRYLLEAAATYGLDLRAGMLISTGAVSGVHEAGVGAVATATFGTHATLACALIAAAPSPGAQGA